MWISEDDLTELPRSILWRPMSKLRKMRGYLLNQHVNGPVSSVWLAKQLMNPLSCLFQEILLSLYIAKYESFTSCLKLKWNIPETSLTFVPTMNIKHQSI